MTAAHTPGLWASYGGTPTGVVAFGPSGSPHLIGWVARHGQEKGRIGRGATPEDVANLHLIKAAPDLLAALQAVEASGSTRLLRGVRHQVRAAILKATGQ